MQRTAEFRLGILLAVFAALGYSLKAIFVKLAYPYGVDAVTLLMLRMAFSLPVFAWVCYDAGPPTQALTRSEWLRIVLMGILGYYGASLLDFWGLQYISAGLERLILFTYPTLTILIGVLFFGRPFARREGIALLLCYGGIGLAFAHDLQVGDATAVVLGGGLVVASSVCYACYLAGSEALIQRVGARRFTALAMLVSTAGIFLHFALARPLTALVQPWPVFGWCLAMAAVSTVAPVFALSEAIRRIGAGRTALTSMLGPPLTIIFGWWLLDEPLSIEQTVGAGLVVAGILVMSKRS